MLSFSSLVSMAVTAEDEFSAGFFDYATNIATGQAWLGIVILAGLFSTLVTAVRQPAGLGFVALLGLCALIPMAMVGHSASGDDHIAAVNSLLLHLVGVVIWVGESWSSRCWLLSCAEAPSRCPPGIRAVPSCWALSCAGTRGW
ncbi:hypothetical protein [Nesterenkonia pannonica]|uniref:hypothetical protein n=1 Tax=Nesterenkonia pannonica TaxID=1548602 RepID=UPI0021641580|nr:hypothetical protein [Nesterenkonia pannonica]